MIRLGLRLAVATGREALLRLVVIAAALAVGAGLLLTTLAATNATQAQNKRYAWLNTGISESATGNPRAADPAWWLVRSDYFGGRLIARLDVAPTGPAGPVPPGLAGLPGPGEFYVSPALDRLLHTTPAAQLADRFPGHQAGVIAAAGLPSPDSLIVVVGHTPDQARALGAEPVDSVMAVDPSRCDDCVIGIAARGITLVLTVVVAALLFPVLIFVATATRLSAARREQRFAAMRLIGATPRQISTLAAVEASVAAAAGTLAGFALFGLLRGALAGLSFTGEPFFRADLALTLGQVFAVALGVPAGAAVASWITLRRVRLSPLGVVRRVTPHPPREWRLIPVLVGLAELGWFVGFPPQSTNGQVAAYLSGILLVMAGLMLTGPWLTMLGSQLLARRATGPAGLIAGRRLADNPHAAFRAISGLTLALFVTSAATGIITTIVANRGAPRSDQAASIALDVIFWPGTGPAPAIGQVPAGLPGRQIVRLNPVRADGRESGVIACADLARTPLLGSCPPGVQAAEVYPDLLGIRTNQQAEEVPPPVWDPSPLTAAEVAELPVLSVVAVTDGSRAQIEQTRTTLETHLPAYVRAPSTPGEFQTQFTNSLVQFQQLADVVVVASMCIAGCSLAVSVAGGLNERKRPFSLLRLTGVKLATLRRVVLAESAVPLVAAAVLAAVLGFAAAALFLRSQMGYSLVAPQPAYFATAVGGIVVSLGIIASTMPLLNRLTGPETARSE